MGASSSDLVSTGALGDWYVKPLFWRPQVALFVSQRSLLPVLVPFAPVASVVRRRPRRIAEIATRLGVGASALGSGLVAMENHVLAKTKSRSVLGVINDFAHQADHYRWGRDRLDLVDLSCWLAETPSGPLSAGTGRPDREPPSPFHPTGARTGRSGRPRRRPTRLLPLEEGASRSGRSPADECEQQEVRSWKYRGVRTMSNEEAAPETKGVTAELLATVDLGPEIEGMAGRQLRMRMFTFEPGAVFGPIHDHKDRPGIVYILQGTITDHRNGVATDYGPGVGWPEDRNTTHWLENRGTVPAVEISVDVIRFAP